MRREFYQIQSFVLLQFKAALFNYSFCQLADELNGEKTRQDTLSPFGSLSISVNGWRQANQIRLIKNRKHVQNNR